MTLNYIHVSVTVIILRRGQQCKVCFSVAGVLMALNYIHVSVTVIILRRGQQYIIGFSVAVGAVAIKLHACFSDS